MRKIFLSLAALTIAVAANAFNLELRNSDKGKSIKITSAVDNADVFEDGGTVAVKFDAAKKAIRVTFTNATLKSNSNNDIFHFESDDNYTDVVVTLNGKNYIIGDYASAKPILIEGPMDQTGVYAHLYFYAGGPGAELNISGQTLLIQMNDNAKMTFGSLLEVPFQLNITSTSANQPIFYGASGIHDSNELQLYCDVNIETTGNNQIAMLDGGTGLGTLTLPASSKIRTEGVTVENNTFVKDGNPYKGNLVLVNAYPVFVGTTRIYADEECKPAGLKSGKISFDKATCSLILDNVELSDYIAGIIDDLTIYLKGDNVMNNPGESAGERIAILGYRIKIDGEKTAKLTIDGNSKCGAVTSLGGLEIGNFAKLTIKDVTYGIAGNNGTLEEDVLKLNNTPMDIKSAIGAIIDFDNLVMAGSGMEWSPAATYSTTVPALVDAENHVLLEVIYANPAAINNVVNSNAVGGKFIRNGQLYIERNGVLYNAAGARVK